MASNNPLNSPSAANAPPGSTMSTDIPSLRRWAATAHSAKPPPRITAVPRHSPAGRSRAWYKSSKGRCGETSARSAAARPPSAPVATTTASGSKAAIPATEAGAFKRTSTPNSASSRSSQSASRPYSAAARSRKRSCPPSRSDASHKITRWPDIARNRAACSPAGPPPATTARRPPAVGRKTRTPSKADCGLAAHPAGVRPTVRLTQPLHPMHGRIASGPPSRKWRT